MNNISDTNILITVCLFGRTTTEKWFQSRIKCTKLKPLVFVHHGARLLSRDRLILVHSVPKEITFQTELSGGHDDRYR